MKNDIYIDNLADWTDELADSIAHHRTGDDGRPSVSVTPMQQIDTYEIRCHEMWPTMVTVVRTQGRCFASFMPKIPEEAILFSSIPPVKTRPLNCQADIDALGKSISMFSGDFKEWAANAILQSQREIQWNAFSVQLMDEARNESWCPNVSKDDAGAIKMQSGKVQATATVDKLAIKFTGKPDDYLDVLRGVFRVSNGDD